MARKLLTGTRELATPTPGTLPILLEKKNPNKLTRGGGGGPMRANTSKIKRAAVPGGGEGPMG